MLFRLLIVSLYHYQNYKTLTMNANAASIKQLFGPKSYRQFRETSPWSLMGGDCLRKVITGGGSTVNNQLPSTEMANDYHMQSCSSSRGMITTLIELRTFQNFSVIKLINF